MKDSFYIKIELLYYHKINLKSIKFSKKKISLEKKIECYSML